MVKRRWLPSATGTPSFADRVAFVLSYLFFVYRCLIRDGSVGIPDEAKAENVRAMADFTKEYGVYR